MIGYTSFGYDVGFNDGYKKGRADQKEKDNAFFNFEATWEMEKKKVREDAYDEFVELYEKFCNSDISCTRETCIGKSCPKCFRDNFMEQVKEHNNG